MDITIKGAGIMGLSIAWALLRGGARVQVIDPNGPGSGASGGVLGALAPHSPDGWNAKKQFQLESLILAERFWRDVEETAEQSSGYGRIGRIQPIETDRGLALAEARAAAAATHWPDGFDWSVRPLTDWPGLAALPHEYAAYDTLSARLDPARAIAALTSGLARLGVSVQPEGAERGQVVHATGHAGLAALSADLGQDWGRAEKGQAARLGITLPDLPQLYIQSMHIVPQADGTVAIGSTSERHFEHADPDEQLDALIAKARACVPVLATAPVIQHWAGLRPRSTTRAPLLGPWPGRPGHFIANGGFKTGFGMAPKMAELMADLLLNGRDTIPDSLRVSPK